MNIKKIIFLDIDGVLNRIGGVNRGFIGMEPELVDRFNKLCEDTSAAVVLSSTWRLSETWEKDMFACGLKCIFIGRTDSLQGYERGHEVDQYLCQLMRMNIDTSFKYAIIDNGADFFKGQPLVQTNYAEGLTEEKANEVRAKLSTV